MIIIRLFPFPSCIPGVRHQPSGEAGHRSGVLRSSDEENPAGPAEDPRGRGRQQAAPAVRTHTCTHTRTWLCIHVTHRVCVEVTGRRCDFPL